MKGGETMLSTLSNRWVNLLSDPFEAMRREFDSSFAWGPDANAPQGMRAYGSLSLWEDGEHVYVEMDVPGMKIEELELTLEKGQLWIRGERKPAKSERKSLHDERPYGRFQRAIALHDAVDPGAVDATLRDGVLYITLTKRREYQPFRIAVKPGDSTQERITSG
jgi:HSP20 family protein